MPAGVRPAPVGMPAMRPTTATPVVPSAQARVVPPAPPAPVTPVTPSGPGSAAPAPSASAHPTPSTLKRSINPFLNNDPNQKARRLARALVSDMIAYLPEKRAEGLRDGTLKTLFREEIKKSYEEYVDQIGKEFAESTPHFQDALNDLLAGGEKMF
jgi:hypothetical protein